MRAILAIASLLIKEILRKKDFYVALIFMVLILFYASQMQFFQVGKIHRYLMEVGLAMSFSFSVILGICLAARQYPQDVEHRTLWVLLSKPVTRTQYVLGKYLGTFFAASVCFAVFFSVFAVFSLLRSADLSWWVMWQTFYFFILCLSVVIAMAIGFSFYLSTAANIVISLLIYFLLNTYGPSLNELPASSPVISKMIAKGIYYAMPHFEFFDLRARFVHGWPALSMPLTFFLSVYAVFYSLVFLAIGIIGFQRKDL